MTPELQGLTGDVLRIWGDSQVREQAFRDIVDEMPPDTSRVFPNSRRLREKIERIDAAIEQGLARLVVRGKAGMNPEEINYELYVRAYRSLANALGTTEERLLREFWQLAPGEVRSNFGEVVDRLWYNQRGTRLDADRKAELGKMADALFLTRPNLAAANAAYTDAQLIEMWRQVLSGQSRSEI